MAEITIGPLHLVSNGMSLSLGPEGQPENAVHLEPVDVGVLIDFLMSLSASEFNRRQAFRIPLWETCGLRVFLEQDEQQVYAVPKNISLTGLLLELDDESDFDPAKESLVEVLIDFEGITQKLVGRVRRRADRKLGLYFPESTLAGEADPTPEYTALVMELQRRWAARRKAV